MCSNICVLSVVYRFEFQFLDTMVNKAPYLEYLVVIPNAVFLRNRNVTQVNISTFLPLLPTYNLTRNND